MINITNKQKLMLLQISLSFAAVCLSGTAAAAAASIVVNGSSQTWASGGTPGATPATDGTRTTANARALDNVSITSAHTLTVTNNTTANDGSGSTNTFSLGDITNPSAAGAVTVQTGSANNLTVGMSSVSLTGAFTTTNNQGTGVTSTTTVTGNFSSGGVATVTGGAHANAASTLILQGATNSASSFSLADGTATATLSFTGAASKTVSGAINGGGTGQGAVTVATSDVTFANTVGSTNRLKNFTVSSGATATLSAGTLAATTITNAGTLVLGAATTATGSTAFTNSGSLNLNATATLSGGTVELNGSGTDSAGIITMGTTSYTDNVMLNAAGISGNVTATHVVKIVPAATFNSGTITVIKTMNSAGSAANAAKFTATNSLITNYAFSLANSNADLNMTATQKPNSEIAASINTNTVAADAFAKAVVATTSNTTVSTAYTNAVSTGGAAAKLAAEQSAPNPDGGFNQISTQTSQVVLNSTSQRLDGLRNGGGAVTMLGAIQSAGLSAGNGAQTMGIWVRPYAYLGKQQDIGSVAGYDSKTRGLIGGFDKRITENMRLGFSVGYSKSNVHSGGVGRNETDIGGKQTTLYGDYTTERYFIESMIGYATNKVDTSRVISFGGLNQKAFGEYDAEQYFARVGAGMPIAFGKGGQHVLTPEIDLDLSRLESDAYTETGADVLNLQVTPDPVNLALASAGIQYKYKHAIRSGILNHTIRLGGGYDMVNENGIATMRFLSGSTAFTSTAPDISPLQGHAGLGIGYTTFDDVFRLMLDYDAEKREGFLGHSIRLEWRYNF